MAEIEEIPISAEGAQENVQDIPEDNQETAQEIPENAPAPKKRGRPSGAKNKPKPKPAPKPKTKAKAKEPEYEDYSEEEEEPPPPRRRAVRQEPVELDRHALASEVLGILQQQRYQRTTARRSHYASWFANL